MFNSNDLSQESLCLTHLLLCESRKVIRVTKLTHPAQATLLAKQWKKEQASRCCTTDIWLRQFVNQQPKNGKTCFFPLLATRIANLTDRGRRSLDLLVHVIEGYVMEESKLDETFMKRLGADSQMTGNLPHWNQGT